jgi:hypothetical protein
MTAARGPLATDKPATSRLIAPVLTLVVLTALGVALYRRGHGFYETTGETRLDHPEVGTLKPSGIIGQGYGVVGTVLIFTNLLYLVRRRLAKLSVGSLRAWLNVHVLSGLAGSLLVVFHSTFQLRSPIATATAISLGVLVATGVIGLYIYRLLPKPGLLRFQARLAEVESVVPTFAKRVRESLATTNCTTLPPNTSLPRALAMVPRWTLEARARRRAVEQAAAEDPMIRRVGRDERPLIQSLIHELADLAAAEIDSSAASALMRSWRSLHGFMAIGMVLSVSVHIGVAWLYGYRWIWSR